jgi:hypothetical protein
MKKISILFITVLLSGLFSCENEKWSFPDFDYTTVYFPYQTPVRTLVLGNYEYNTTLQDDNNLNFIISAHLGGVYDNTKDQTVDYEIKPELATKLKTGAGDILEALPTSYYTLTPVNQFVIPAGKYYDGFKVQLTDAFLDDPLSYTNHYVLPCVIIKTSLDSILSGKALVANPDRRIPGNWSVAPRDYTVFGVKYVNAYHGKYLTRGKSVRKDASNVTIDSVVYHKTYVEQDEIWSLKTLSRNKVTLTGVAIKAKTGSPGTLRMDLAFDANGNCVVTNNPASTFVIAGTGKFVKDGDTWGGKKRDAIYLSYQITVAATKHIINDTLVVRDRDVRFETFVPVVIP